MVADAVTPPNHYNRHDDNDYAAVVKAPPWLVLRDDGTTDMYRSNHGPD